MKMLSCHSRCVLSHKADVGLGFDGDGDRCGVVDDTATNLRDKVA